MRVCVPVGALEALGSFRAVFAEVVVGAVESVLFESAGWGLETLGRTCVCRRGPGL